MDQATSRRSPPRRLGPGAPRRGRRPSGRVLALVAIASLLPVAGSLAASRDRDRAARRDTARLERRSLEQVAHPTLDVRRPASDLPVEGVRLHLETDTVSFREVVPGEAAEVAGAVTLRVVSDRRWSLRLRPDPWLTVADHASPVPVSRLSWRSESSNAFRPFRSGTHVVIARGPATHGAGQSVVIDLRLRLDDMDPLGRYVCNLEFIVDSR